MIATAQLALVAGAQAEGQDETAYSVPRGLTLRDEIPRYFRIAQALWKDLAASDTTSNTATVTFVERLLRDVLGFTDVSRAPVRTHDGRTHPVTLEALGGRVPVVVAPPSDPLDRPSPSLSIGGRRTSAALALQDWLNAAENTLWGLACNGEKLRLVRDNPSLTRPAYIEADLRRMFEGDAFADFTALWLLLHVSRFGLAGAPVTDCALERWRDAGQKAGVAARDRLRDGFEEALRAFGTGFLSHPANGELRRKLEAKELDLLDFHGLLLRLVYRLIFLLVAEDRNLLHPTDASATARKLYTDGYSLSRLRARSAKRVAWDAHDDLWDGLKIAFVSLAKGEPSLALPALAGLFAPGGLGELDVCDLPNRALMRAIYRLAWLKDGGAIVPVNWRDMETEELGSVYESLLELTPRLTDDGRGYGFAEGTETRGNQRKTTGSYYTPDSLVQVLLNSTLDPVLDRAERQSETPAEALLAINVIDPACGSGHFLLAAARRIATRVARHRADGAASADDYRHALRDVARNCIHGVDRNPMAVELTKVALWIETVEPGKPLGFLDGNIRCGDALFGVFDLTSLDKGVPDTAYKPLTGDDPQAARIAGKVNRDQRLNNRQGDLVAGLVARDLAQEALSVASMAEDDIASVKRKADAYLALRATAGWAATKLACDIYVAAFLRKKAFRTDALASAQFPDCVPTTLDLNTALVGRQPDLVLAAMSVNLARQANAFHWPLEFPAAMEMGGFDVVLGNPPWERIKLQEQEFFAPRAPEISEAPTAAARGRLIASLREHSSGTWERELYEEFVIAKRTSEASSVFSRTPVDDGGRFPLTGQGDVNTYALFSELFLALTKNDVGRAGCIVPTGLITDLGTSDIFRYMIENRKLISSIAFDNQRRIFPGVHPDTPFTLLTMGSASDLPKFSAYLLSTDDMLDERRSYSLSQKNISDINPNTFTCPMFRSREDARITEKVHAAAPVFIRTGEEHGAGSWMASFHTRIWHMAEDSEWFKTSEELLAEDVTHGSNWSALYEAKLVHQHDHRWATYDGAVSRYVSESEKQDVEFKVTPRYWVSSTEVNRRLAEKSWKYDWLMGWRGISNATNERSLIASVFPRSAVGHSLPLIMPGANAGLICCLIANLSTIVIDYILRQKLGGTNVTFQYLFQLPIFDPEKYSEEDVEFISSRVLELNYTSTALNAFALDLGYKGPPFAWVEERRALLRAELDAWYARAFHLTYDELRYILDPADVMGLDYPSETFRVLKEKEIRRYGEYRTQRLVLEAWTALNAKDQNFFAAVTAPRTHPSAQSEGSWARPPANATTLLQQTSVQIAAVLKALWCPTAEQEVRLAALYALQPDILAARLTGIERTQWSQAVGPEASPRPTNIVTFGLGGAAGWSSALQQLKLQNALIVDASANTWAPGPGLANYYTEDTWTERAGFALDIAARVMAVQGGALTADEARGVAAIAA